MRAVRVAAAGALVLGALGAVAVGPAAPPAAADCAGPSFEHEVGPVGRGEVLVVRGTGFGDNCYDTGPPPAGQGVLGKPRTGIQVLIVQGGDEHLVAEGGADEGYAFTAEVVVPADLEPGEADVVVRLPDGFEPFDTGGVPFTVSDDPPAAGAGEEVASFGPPGGSGAQPEVVQVPGEGEEGGPVVRRGGTPGPSLVPLVASGVAFLAVAGVLAWRRFRGPGDEPSTDDEPEG